MTQYGFFFDQSRCTNCHACSVACRDWNNPGTIQSSPEKWLRMMQWEKGAFPNVEMHTLFATCYHCENPACVAACPSHALFKEDEFGAVLVDASLCTGCRECYDVCPYGAPQFADDEVGTCMGKCDMCYDRLLEGELPICVAGCPNRALDFGTMEDMEARYGTCHGFEDMPSPETTNPSLVLKERSARQQYVVYDEARVLELMAKRADTGLPDVYGDPDDVTGLFDGLVGYDKLVMKGASVWENLARSKNEEG